MDATDLRTLATNALTGHWPAHLGVATDAEKIEYLARRLEELADNAESVERLEEQVDKLTDKVGELTDELGELEEIDAYADCELCDTHK